MDDEVYLAGDVDSIQDYVFETSSLPQIRGGSALLQRCEDAIRDEKGSLRSRYGFEVLYCAGGSFLLKVKRDLAPAVKREIEQLYRNETLTVTVTVVYEDGPVVAEQPRLPADGLDGWALRLVNAARASYEGGDFPLRMAHLMARLREAKQSRIHVPFFQAHPFGQRCNRCGKRMVVHIDQELGERLCQVCHRRDNEGRRHADGYDLRGKFNREFWDVYGSGRRPKQPADLDTLVQKGTRGYLAFLHADGNDIGRLLGRVRKDSDYKSLSEALIKVTKDALYDALNEVCRDQLEGENTWPFDILNVGGDDVTLLLHGGYAWEVAVKFLEKFEERASQHMREIMRWDDTGTDAHVTASCAIVIADVKFPVRYLQRLTKGLLGKAKRTAKARRSSALTFLWLPEPVASEHVEPLLSAYETRLGGAERISLLGRPYTLEQARVLLEASKELARQPRSLRHRWQEVLSKGVMISTSLIAYDIARRKRAEQEVMLTTLERLAVTLSPGASGSHQLSPPVWVLDTSSSDGGPAWRTAFMDALELAELHAMRPGWESEVSGG
jgi:hypothetical protein